MSYTPNQEKFIIDTTGQITGNQLVDATITETKIANSAITESKIASSAVTEVKIGSAAVTEAKIGSAAVTTAKIANVAVDNTKIASAAVTSTKLATGATERDWVLARTAAASVGVVGSYAMLADTTLGTGFTYAPGATISGSNVFFGGIGYSSASPTTYKFSTTPSGTWRCMGYFDADSATLTVVSAITLWIRIS